MTDGEYNSDLESAVEVDSVDQLGSIDEGYQDEEHVDPTGNDTVRGASLDTEDTQSLKTLESSIDEPAAPPSFKEIKPEPSGETDGEIQVEKTYESARDQEPSLAGSIMTGGPAPLGSADKVLLKSLVETLMGEAEELALLRSKSLFTNSELGLKTKKVEAPHSEPYQQLKVVYEEEESEFASKMPSIMELYTSGIETGLTLNDFAWPKFALDDPDQIYENLLAMTVINPDLCVMQNERIIMRKDHYQAMANKVKIIIGGPAGNEPMFSGYVGKGMATAAVIGDRKNVPKSLAIYKTIKELALHHSAGILMIIPNSAECRIVFGLAMEKARSEGHLVDMIVVADDCCDHVMSQTGRRTLAGYVLALKVAGAMSEDDRTMKEIYLMVRNLLIVSISAHINHTNIFMGTGIKDGGFQIKCVCNEFEEDCQKQPSRGCATRTHNKLRTIIETMMDFATGYKRYFSIPLKPFAQVVVLVNCYTEDKLFLYSVVAEVLRQIYCHDVAATRVYAECCGEWNSSDVLPLGTFVSSRRGFSISFLKVINEEVYYWLDYPTDVSIWPPPRDPGIIPVVTKSVHDLPILSKKRSFGPKFNTREQIFIPFIITAIVEDLVIMEAILNQLDPDDTFGSCIVKGFRGLEAANKSQQLDYTRPYNLFHQVAQIMEDSSFGATASFLALFYGAIGNEFLKYSENAELEYRMYGSALISAADVIATYALINPETDAYVGDVCIPAGRLLMDAAPELPAVEVLDSMFKVCKNSINQARSKPSGMHRKGKEECGSVAVLFILKSIIRVRKKVEF